MLHLAIQWSQWKLALLILCLTQPSFKDIHLSENIDAAMELATIQVITNSSNEVTAMLPDHICVSGQNDHSCATLINRHQLSIERDLVLINKRIVVPKFIRRKVLRCSLSAHQDVEGIKAHANDSVYWPGMNVSICNFRASCSTCARQPQEPITMTPAPEWPFQQIVMEIFYIGHIAYLACADRLTGSLILYHLKHMPPQMNSAQTMAHLLPPVYSKNSFRCGV